MTMKRLTKFANLPNGSRVCGWLEYDRDALAADLTAKAARNKSGQVNLKGGVMSATANKLEFDDERFLSEQIATGRIGTWRLFGGRVRVKARVVAC